MAPIVWLEALAVKTADSTKIVVQDMEDIELSLSQNSNPTQNSLSQSSCGEAEKSKGEPVLISYHDLLQQ